MKFSIIYFLSVFLWIVPANSFAADQGKTMSLPNPYFEAIKSLAGTWVGEGKKDGKTEPVKIKYRVTAGGTAVEEILFPGTPKEMVSVYFLDGDQLMMTHYCMLGNQPRMKMTEGKKIKKGEKISLKMVDATGMESPQEPHMGALTLTLKGPDRLIQEWTLSGPGRDQNTVFELKRQK